MRFLKVGAAVAACMTFFAGGLATAQDEPSFGQRFDSGRSSAESQRAQKEAVMPRCSGPIGTVAIAPPEKNWWTAVQLQSPEALIKMFVARSNCFTIVDRGRGATIAAGERALASSGTLQQGSNIGGGQMRAADYVITPDIVVSNNNAGGNSFGAILGALIPGIGGAIAGSLRMTDQKADVTLAVTDVRTSEQVVLAEGHAQKTDIGFGIGGGAFLGGGFAAAGAGSYENTALGQVVATAYLDAYSKMIASVQGLGGVEHPIATPLAPPPPQTVIVQQQPPQQQAAARIPVGVARTGVMYGSPDEKSTKLRELRPGTILYKTGNESGAWLEVEPADTPGARGWIQRRIL